MKTVGLYFIGGSVVAHFRIRKYRESKLKESKSKTLRTLVPF